MRNIIRVLRRITEDERLNVPAQTIANYAGVSKSAVTSYIRGETYPTEDIEMKLWQGIENYVNEMNQAYENP